MMETMKIDVMLNGGGKFYKTLRYKYSTLFQFNYDAMFDWVMEQLPSLKNRDDYILVMDIQP